MDIHEAHAKPTVQQLGIGLNGQLPQGPGVRTHRADVLLLVVAVVWGSSYLATQRAAVLLGVLPVLALRFGIAALALTAVCLVSNQWRPTRVELGLGLCWAAARLRSWRWRPRG
jgi:drug/metabolite transporter (DMT)-like permease